MIFSIHENYFYFFMLRDVPECSGMFHVPGFIDAPFRQPYQTVSSVYFILGILRTDLWSQGTVKRFIPCNHVKICHLS